MSMCLSNYIISLAFVGDCDRMLSANKRLVTRVKMNFTMEVIDCYSVSIFRLGDGSTRSFQAQ